MSASASITITPSGSSRRRATTRGTQVIIETGGAVVVGGDVAVWFGDLDEPQTEGQLRVRALDPALVWSRPLETKKPPRRRGKSAPAAVPPWLGDRDSNPDSSVQSRLSYH